VLKKSTATSSFGVGAREGHDASKYYSRKMCASPHGIVSFGTTNSIPDIALDRIIPSSSENMGELPDNCIALMVTSPPYNVGKDYDEDLSLEQYMAFLERVLSETFRVLVPGGRIAFNVANLGRKPYIPLNSHISALASRLGFLMRGEVIWVKAKGAASSCAWGSWMSASNPTLRDLHEYVLIFSKGSFNRADRGESTISRDEFMAATSSVWEIPAESARRVGHPAPFPTALVERLIHLYTYRGDVVLDPFMGSGTTAVAALRTGRRFIGYETNPKYVEICARRLQAERALFHRTAGGPKLRRIADRGRLDPPAAASASGL
jgi:site-specific DNA-methyltransferase (adenine-specific)